MGIEKEEGFRVKAETATDAVYDAIRRFNEYHRPRAAEHCTIVDENGTVLVASPVNYE